MSITGRGLIPILFGAELRGAVGDKETATAPPTAAEEAAAAAAAGSGGGSGGSGGGSGGGSSAPTESFESCRAKYGISDAEAVGTANEGNPHPYGTSPEGLARERAVDAARSADADPTGATPNDASVEPIGCTGTKNADDNFRLSPRFTVSDLSIHCPNSPTHIGNGSVSFDTETGKSRVYGRAEIICNLRHLAVNALEKIFDHFTKLGYKIVLSSGYRVGKSDEKSDHTKGQAMDLIFWYDGRRIEGKDLVRIQKVIDEVLRIPYTQMIFETPGPNGDILHIACRRSGKKSGLRICWSTGNGHTGSIHGGYKYNCTIAGSPPVK